MAVENAILVGGGGGGMRFAVQRVPRVEIMLNKMKALIFSY